MNIKPWHIGVGLFVLFMLGIFALILLPNRGIRQPEIRAPRTDRGFLRNVLGQI